MLEGLSAYGVLIVILLLIEYVLMRILGTRHFRLLPHWLAIIASWHLNFATTILCLKSVDALRISLGPGDSAIGGAIVFVCYGFLLWVIGLLFYQVYGFFAGFSGRIKAIVFVVGSVLSVLLCTVVSNLFGGAPHALTVPAAMLYAFVVVQTAFWVMFVVEFAVDATFRGIRARDQKTERA